MTVPSPPPYARLRDCGFWAELVPGLTLGDGSPDAEAIDAEAVAPLAARMAQEGYLQGAAPALSALAPRLADGVERIAAAGLPPPFLFLFDEAWAGFAALRPVLTALLGADYRMLPDFWTWRLDPGAEDAGWRPHRDKGRRALSASGAPLAVTVWIPLTPANPLNGCMYLVPADRDPVYGKADEDKMAFALPDIRALPAHPGEFLCWNQAILHWGARSSRHAEAPRLSMALEFQRGDIAPFGEPLTRPDELLPFEKRLKLVALQILHYAHMYPLAPELKAAAEAILAR